MTHHQKWVWQRAQVALLTLQVDELNKIALGINRQLQVCLDACAIECSEEQFSQLLKAIRFFLWYYRQKSLVERHRKIFLNLDRAVQFYRATGYKLENSVTTK